MNILKVFQKSPSKNYSPSVPSGLIAQTEKGYFYIKGSKKFKFVSDRAMLSWTLPVIKTTDDKISGIPTSGLLGFRDGTLVKNIADGKIYLISDSKRRHITDPDVLEWLDTEIVRAGEKEISIHPEGDKL
jgi:hypothetical protein